MNQIISVQLIDSSLRPVALETVFEPNHFYIPENKHFRVRFEFIDVVDVRSIRLNGLTVNPNLIIFPDESGKIVDVKLHSFFPNLQNLVQNYFIHIEMDNDLFIVFEFYAHFVPRYEFYYECARQLRCIRNLECKIENGEMVEAKIQYYEYDFYSHLHQD